MKRLLGFEGLLATAAFPEVRFEFRTRIFRELLIQEQGDLMLILFTIKVHMFDKYALSF